MMSRSKRLLATACITIACAAGSACGREAGGKGASQPGNTGSGEGGDGSGDGNGTSAGDSSGGDSSGEGSASGGGGSSDDGGNSEDGGTTGDGIEFSVLFLGNSYTAANDLPGLVASFAAGANVTIEKDAYTIGGATTAQLAADDQVQQVIASRQWDFVVIQGQSYEPMVQYDLFFSGAVDLAGQARAVGALPVLFETWARGEGSDFYETIFPGGSPEQMQQILHDAYAGVAENVGGVLAPVGQGWEHSLSNAPDIVLHSGDLSHPALTGSYLAAAVFVAVLAATPAENNPFVPDGIDQSDAASLQASADAVVFP